MESLFGCKAHDLKVASSAMFLKSGLVSKITIVKKAKFFKTGSPWVYSNECVRMDTQLPPGSWVSLENEGGKTVGYGYFNPHSLIAFRCFERIPFQSAELTRKVFNERMQQAWLHRQQAFMSYMKSGVIGPYSFRLVFGESDGLPGMVVDLFECEDTASSKAVAVVQNHAAGADHWIPWLQEWLEKNLGIRSGVLRNDLDVRHRERAPVYQESWGTIPSKIFVKEGGVRFSVHPHTGQKTGYFYDHRSNRFQFSKWCQQIDQGVVADIFSYTGSWGLQAIRHNPKLRLIAVDVSKTALNHLLAHAEENQLQDRVEILELDFIKEGKDWNPGVRFDALSCDPPALTASAKHARAGEKALHQCFSASLRKLKHQGFFAFSSCSYHLHWDNFLTISAEAAFEDQSELQWNFYGSQDADHPVLSTLAESRYLKCVMGHKFKIGTV